MMIVKALIESKNLHAEKESGWERKEVMREERNVREKIAN